MASSASRAWAFSASVAGLPWLLLPSTEVNPQPLTVWANGKGFSSGIVRMRRVHFQGALDLPRVMAVDHAHSHTSSAELGGGDVRGLLRAHCVGLPIALQLKIGQTAVR